MASFQSFANTASNVVEDASERTITISNEVVEIDGVLDEPTGGWSGYTIICQNSGGFRSTSGASGTIGGAKHSVKIIEKSNGHRFGGDNFSGSNGSNARFAGDATNLLKYNNIIWIVETGNRSDFDIGRGTSSDGSSGPKVEFSGVNVIMLTQSGQTAHFNHYSGNASIRIHPDVGYGLRMENRTNGPAWEFSTPIQTGAVVEGLVIANVTSPTNNSSGSRAAVRLDAVAQNGTMTLTALNTPSIAAVDNAANASKTLLLIDPVGRPTRNDWSNQYHGIFEIRRTVPFAFEGVSVPSGTTLFADVVGTGVSSTGTASGRDGSVVVRTDISPHNASGGAWTTQNQYKFYMVGTTFQKYSTATTTISNTPSTIDATLIQDVFPDGTAITALSSGSVSNIAELYRALKTYGVANRLEPSADESLVKIDTNGNIVMGTGATLAFSTIQTPLVAETNNQFTVKVSSTEYIGPSSGINSLNLGSSNTADASVTSRLRFPYTDSTGTSSLITVSAPDSSRISVFKNDGTSLGSNNDFTDDWNLIVSASDSAANTRIGYVGTDTTREIASRTIDISSGGSYSVEFTEGRAINDPLGTAILSGVSSKSGLSVNIISSGTNLGRATINIPNSSTTVKEVLKGVYDAISTATGCRFAAFGRQLPSVTDLSGQTANLFLGPDARLRPGLSTNTESAISGFVFGGIGGNPQVVNGNAKVAYIPAISTGGGGGGATAQQIWEYSARTLTSDAAPSASSVATAVWDASTRTLTSDAAPSASDVADAVWSSDDAVSEPPSASSIATAVWASDDAVSTSTIASSVWSFSTRVLSSNTGIVNGVWSASSRSLTSYSGVGSEVWGATTRTITTDIPTTAEIADEVWGTDIQVISNTSETFSPSFIFASGFLLVDSSDTIGMENGDPIGINDDGGYTNLVEGTTYYARPNGTLLELYSDRDDAINGTGERIVPSGGTPASLVLSITRMAVSRELGEAKDVIKDILLDTEAVIAPPTAMAISDAVLNATIHEGQRAAHDFIPIDEDKNAFRVNSSDGNKLRNGDTIRFTNNGGYTAITINVDYFIYKAYDDIFIYRNADNARAGNSQYVTIGTNGTPTDVRITRVADSGFVTVKGAIDALLSNTDSTIQGIDAVLDGIADFTGADFVENGMSMAQALQIITAISAGKLVVSNNGGTFTFHRMDTGETAVIRSNASEDGRTAPTRNPT